MPVRSLLWLIGIILASLTISRLATPTTWKPTASATSAKTVGALMSMPFMTEEPTTKTAALPPARPPTC